MHRHRLERENTFIMSGRQGEGRASQSGWIVWNMMRKGEGGKERREGRREEGSEERPPVEGGWGVWGEGKGS